MPTLAIISGLNGASDRAPIRPEADLLHIIRRRQAAASEIPTMRLMFDPASFLRAALLSAVLVLLAVFGRNLGWVRGFMGDVLAVAWVFHAVRAFVRAGPAPVAVVAFAAGAAVELVQYVLTVIDVRIPSRTLRIVLGATPDWWDILAYAIGAALVLGLALLESERRREGQSRSRRSSPSGDRRKGSEGCASHGAGSGGSQRA